MTVLKELTNKNFLRYAPIALNKSPLMNMSLLIHEMTSGTNNLDWHLWKRKLVVAHWLLVQMNKVVACLHPLLPQVSKEKLSEALSILRNAIGTVWSIIQKVHLTEVKAILYYNHMTYHLISPLTRPKSD